MPGRGGRHQKPRDKKFFGTKYFTSIINILSHKNPTSANSLDVNWRKLLFHNQWSKEAQYIDRMKRGAQLNQDLMWKRMFQEFKSKLANQISLAVGGLKQMLYKGKTKGDVPTRKLLNKDFSVLVTSAENLKVLEEFGKNNPGKSINFPGVLINMDEANVSNNELADENHHQNSVEIIEQVTEESARESSATDGDRDRPQCTLKKSRAYLHLLRFHLPEETSSGPRKPLSYVLLETEGEETDIEIDKDGSCHVGAGMKLHNFEHSSGMDWVFVPSDDCFYGHEGSDRHESDLEQGVAPNKRRMACSKRKEYEDKHTDRLSLSTRGSNLAMPCIVVRCKPRFNS